MTTTSTNGVQLVDLIGRIRAEHDRCETAAREALIHAFEVGRLLVEAKGRVDHGAWLPWVREHCPFSERTAQAYMRVYRHRSELEANAQSTAVLSLDGALRLLSSPGDAAEKAVRRGLATKARVEALDARLTALDGSSSGGASELANIVQEAKELERTSTEQHEHAERERARLLNELAKRLGVPATDIAANLDQILLLCEARLAELET